MISLPAIGIETDSVNKKRERGGGEERGEKGGGGEKRGYNLE